MSTPDDILSCDADFVTLLLTDRELRKRVTAQETFGAQVPKRFDRVVVKPFSGLDDIFTKLKALESVPGACLIRGKLIDPGNDRNVLRRMKHGRDGAQPTLEGAAHRWLCVDIDEVGYQGAHESTEGVRAAMKAARLPTALTRAGFVYQWSASAGIDGWKLARLHLWFWMDRPLCDGSIKAWMTQRKAIVDMSLYNPIQLHFTAAPRFDGVDDPVTDRTVLVKGDPVKVPPMVLGPDRWAKAVARKREQEAAQRREAVEARRSLMTARQEQRTADPEVRQASFIKPAVDLFLESVKGGRHRALFKAAADIGNWIGEAIYDEDYAFSVLEEAAIAHMSDRSKSEIFRCIRDGIEAGKETPKRLER